MKNWFYQLWSRIMGVNALSTPPDVIINQMNEIRALPMGMQAFDDWSDRIISGALLPGDPVQLKKSQRFALAEMIMHLKPIEDHVPDAYFIHALRKGAANEIAWAIIKEFQDEKKRKVADESLKMAESVTQRPRIIPAAATNEDVRQPSAL